MLGIWIEGKLDPTISPTAQRVFDETANGARKGFSIFGPYTWKGEEQCDSHGCAIPYQTTFETIGVVTKPSCPLAEIMEFDPVTGAIKGWANVEVPDSQRERYAIDAVKTAAELDLYLDVKDAWFTDEHFAAKVGTCKLYEIIDYDDAAAKGMPMPVYYAEKMLAEKKVKKIGDKWYVVHCHGPDKGKPIGGGHDTREGAERQHRAIEARLHSNKSELSSAGDAGAVNEYPSRGREGDSMSEVTQEDIQALTAALKANTAAKAEGPQEATPEVTMNDVLLAVKSNGDAINTGFSGLGSSLGDTIASAIKSAMKTEPEAEAEAEAEPEPQPEAEKSWVDEAKAAGWTAPSSSGDGAPVPTEGMAAKNAPAEEFAALSALKSTWGRS